ncbi:MAG: hypothetical protein CL938_13030 [Deltaproteobacteria bacterium]|nr:hypothetical protein [Deltaproteobacteria bacterium]
MRRRPILGFMTGALLLAACQEANREPVPTAQAAPADAELAALRRELANERRLRAELTAKLMAQQHRIEELTAAAKTPAPEADDESATTPAEKEPGQGTPAARTKGPRRWFNAEALLHRGIPPHEVERLYEYFGKSQMDLIELQHRAMREDWFKTPRYREARQQTSAEFRTEIGDEDYDLLLFGTGKHNRVVVADIVDRSPGSHAGFVPGDVIIRYDGSRIFHGAELQRSSTSGKIGESVPVEVLRNGEIVRLYIDRGPMGFGLKHRLMWPHLLP